MGSYEYRLPKRNHLTRQDEARLSSDDFLYYLHLHQFHYCNFNTSYLFNSQVSFLGSHTVTRSRHYLLLNQFQNIPENDWRRKVSIWWQNIKLSQRWRGKSLQKRHKFWWVSNQYLRKSPLWKSSLRKQIRWAVRWWADGTLKCKI